MSVILITANFKFRNRSTCSKELIKRADKVCGDSQDLKSPGKATVAQKQYHITTQTARKDLFFKAWFPLVPRIVRIGDFYDIPTSRILTTSGNTSSQKAQTVGDFYDVIGRIGITSTLKVLSQTSQTSAIFTMTANLAVLRIAIVVRIPVLGNRKNHS